MKMEEQKQKDIDNWLEKLANDKNEKKKKENLEFMKGLSF